jgi:hypothetical protein
VSDQAQDPFDLLLADVVMPVISGRIWKVNGPTASCMS